MPELDLNLLYILIVIADKRSVSAAAVSLNKSQPTVSAALTKLRDFFNDPLFVRSGNHMQPTPKACSLIESSRAVLERIGTDIFTAKTFDPATMRKTITLALSDGGEAVFLPTILQELRCIAPHLGVRSVAVSACDVEDGLEAGTIDLALGYFPDLKKHNFFQQTLHFDKFVGLLRADHPIVTSKLAAAEYLQLGHVEVRVKSRTEELIGSYLEQHKMNRRVVVTTPHFCSAAVIVSQSDMVLTLPEPIANCLLSDLSRVRIVELPFDFPRVEIKQTWHRKFHHDDRHRWLRNMVCRLFQESRRVVGGGQAQPDAALLPMRKNQSHAEGLSGW